MPSELTNMKEVRRGPTTTLTFTVVTYSQDPNVLLESSTIEVGDMIKVSVKYECTSDAKLLPYVKMKKIEGIQNSAVPVTIICGSYNAQFYCSDEWIEVQLNEVPHISSRQIDAGYNNRKILLYIIHIKISVKNTMPTALLPNKELYEDTESTDFQLVTADGAVPVHKVILFLHSNMFKMMLIRDWKESTEGRISMDGITVQTLHDLKDYMYLGTLPDEGLEKLLQLAAHYFMDKLRADCSARILESITPENFDRVLTLACEFNIPELARGLVIQVPDNVVNDIYKTKNKELKSDDKK